MLKCDNKISCVKYQCGFIDGRLGEKVGLHDEAQHKFVWEKAAGTRSRIGVKHWKENPKVNTKKVAK